MPTTYYSINQTNSLCQQLPMQAHKMEAGNTVLVNKLQDNGDNSNM